MAIGAGVNGKGDFSTSDRQQRAQRESSDLSFVGLFFFKLTFWFWAWALQCRGAAVQLKEAHFRPIYR